MQAVAKPLHTLLASSAFCEYGGTQTRPEYDERPVDMPPMVSVTTVPHNSVEELSYAAVLYNGDAYVL